MKHVFSRTMNVFLFCCLAGFLSLPTAAVAQSHVVSTESVNRDIAAASASRRNNVAQLDRFFASPRAQKALKSAHLDLQQIKGAVNAMSDADLSRLAARSAKTQRDFSAGALTNEQLTYAVIALGVAVIILIIVEA